MHVSTNISLCNSSVYKCVQIYSERVTWNLQKSECVTVQVECSEKQVWILSVMKSSTDGSVACYTWKSLFKNHNFTLKLYTSIPLFFSFSISFSSCFFKIKFIIIIFLIQALLNKGIFCFLLLQNCSNFYCQQISSSTGLIL